MASIPSLAEAGATDVQVTLRPFCPTFQATDEVLHSLAATFKAAG
jgi:hypothetical protein